MKNKISITSHHSIALQVMLLTSGVERGSDAGQSEGGMCKLREGVGGGGGGEERGAGQGEKPLMLSSSKAHTKPLISPATRRTCTKQQLASETTHLTIKIHICSI